MNASTVRRRTPGVTALMVRTPEKELVAAVEQANAYPTRSNRLRVEAIRREIRETAKEGGGRSR